MSSESEIMEKAIKTTRPLKVLISMLILVIAISVALILSLGFGGNIINNYRQTLWTVTTQGTASSLKEADPHIQKVYAEYKDFLNNAKKTNKVEGIYERIHAGDYSYENIQDETNNGQYFIESFVFFNSPDEANETFLKLKTTLQDAGYEAKNNTSFEDSQVDVKRQFIPARENSSASPGNDNLIASLNERNGYQVIMFSYSSTELPLNKIPTNNDKNYSVTELKKMWDKVISKDIDLCEYEPNGAIGGWYPEYKCLQDSL